MVLDEERARVFDGEHMRREWMLEGRRLQALGLLYYAKAMEGDIQSAAIYLKASGRRATMRGMSAPIAAAVQLIHSTAPPVQIDRGNCGCAR